MTDEEVEKGRQWLEYLETQKPRPPELLTIESAIRRVPGSARVKIEAERARSPVPLTKISDKEAEALVRAAEHKGNPRIESTVVRRLDHFLPYPFAVFSGAEPDLVS